VTGLVFLAVALVVSVAGSLMLWFRQRDPTSLDSGIDQFQREMRAIAPDEHD
jgi:hypothetical protein